MNNFQFYPLDGTTQTVAYTGTAGVSGTAFGATKGQTFRIRVVSTTDCFVKMGASPTATTSDMPLFAKVPEIFACRPGEKISAVQSSSGGNLFVTELSS